MKAKIDVCKGVIDFIRRHGTIVPMSADEKEVEYLFLNCWLEVHEGGIVVFEYNLIGELPEYLEKMMNENPGIDFRPKKIVPLTKEDVIEY